MLRTVECTKVAIDYRRFAVCHIQNLSSYWTLQLLYLDYTSYFPFVRHWTFKLDYCTASYVPFIPFRLIVNV